MHPRDFFFWLQGFFELVALATPAYDHTPSVAKCITDHAELVIKTLAETGQKPPLPILTIRDNASNLVVVRALVNAAFIHEIDKSFPPLHKDPAHSGGQSSQGAPVLMRC